MCIGIKVLLLPIAAIAAALAASTTLPVTAADVPVTL
jgi:hypothetical protein